VPEDLTPEAAAAWRRRAFVEAELREGMGEKSRGAVLGQLSPSKNAIEDIATTARLLLPHWPHLRRFLGAFEGSRGARGRGMGKGGSFASNPPAEEQVLEEEVEQEEDSEDEQEEEEKGEEEGEEGWKQEAGGGRGDAQAGAGDSAPQAEELQASREPGSATRRPGLKFSAQAPPPKLGFLASLARGGLSAPVSAAPEYTAAATAEARRLVATKGASTAAPVEAGEGFLEDYEEESGESEEQELDGGGDGAEEDDGEADGQETQLEGEDIEDDQESHEGGGGDGALDAETQLEDAISVSSSQQPPPKKGRTGGL